MVYNGQSILLKIGDNLESSIYVADVVNLDRVISIIATTYFCLGVVCARQGKTLKTRDVSCCKKSIQHCRPNSMVEFGKTVSLKRTLGASK